MELRELHELLKWPLMGVNMLNAREWNGGAALEKDAALHIEVVLAYAIAKTIIG